MNKILWIRLWDSEEVKEAQQFILSLGEEELLGEIPVILYINSTREKTKLSHIYDVSDDALIPLYEKYGDENVRMESSPDAVAWHLMAEPEPETYDTVQENPLVRIADALESISSILSEMSLSLDSIDQTLTGCIASNGNNHFLCITGNVSTN